MKHHPYFVHLSVTIAVDRLLTELRKHAEYNDRTLDQALEDAIAREKYRGQ